MMPVGTPQDVTALRASLWDAGYRPVPVYNHDHEDPKRAGKAPMGRDWGNEARANPPAAVASAAHRAALNTGILCDGLRAIDVDIDRPEVAARVKAMALDMFGEAPMRYRGNSPRVLLLYRAAQGTPDKRTLAGMYGKVEVLGRGQQFVAFGVHPSGADLQWMPEAPGETMLAGLPAVTEAQIEAFLDAVAPVIGAQQLPKSATGEQAQSPRGLGADPLQVVAALSSIPNAGSADWEGWNRVGMATWAATGGGEAGRAAFHAWSQQHPAYDAAETNARWDHYRTSPPTQIGAGTLFYMAKQARPQQEEAPPEWPEMEGAEPAQDPPRNQNHPETAPLPLVYFDDITPSLESRDFVQGVLEEQSAAMLYGESNSGKTFFATNLAFHVAAGLPWRGRRVDQGGVVYAALEGNRGFRNRIAALKADHDTLPGKVALAAIQSSVSMLDADADVPALIASIHAAAAHLGMPVKLVVIDTLSRALQGGDENSSVDMGVLVKNMDRVRAETGACVLFIHHSGKDAAKGARGWSGIRAAIDTEIEVRVDAEGARVAETVKQREMKKGDLFAFALEVVELGHNQHGEPVTTCLVRFSDAETHAGASLSRRRLPVQQQRALEVLADLVATAGQSGSPATPAGIPSVPEKWWRERFYDRAMPGADEETKRKAFRRAADALVSGKIVGMSVGRVWVVSRYAQEGTPS